MADRSRRGKAQPAGEGAPEVPDVSAASKPEELESSADVDAAAAAALGRAMRNARERGLRPGSRPIKSRRSAKPHPRDGQGRDPGLLGDQLDKLLADRGWNLDVAAGAVIGRWPAIVGSDVAAHTKPITFQDGELVVAADSTAWATNLRLMVSTLMARIEAEVGPDVVGEIRVVGPGAPSWVRGQRRVQGPGPRDTYG